MHRARFLFWLDLILLLAVAPLEEPRTTGLPGHEWLGIVFTALLALHLLVNWRWIVNTLRRLAPNTRRARINAALNGSLFATMAFTVFSGVVISEVVLPLAGGRPSDLRAWRQLHSFVAGVTLAVIGLHVALNWDWIVNVVSKWKARRAPVASGRSLVQRLGLDDVGAAARRLAIITAATAVLCAAAFLLVESTASTTIRRRRELAWAHPDLPGAPMEIAEQLLIVAGVALVGRRVLRLKL